MRPPAEPRPEPRRLIDKIRESGGRGEVPPGFGNIVATTTADHQVYFIAEKGVSSGVMADRIDPERTNPDIPKLVQREELPYGATTPFVQRTFGAGAELLDLTYLPEGFPRERALMIALAAAKDLAAVADTVAELRASEADVRARMDRGEITKALLPRTPNLQGRTEQAIAHLRSVQTGLIELATIFYPKARRNSIWAESVRSGLRSDDPLLERIDDIVAALDVIANCRNAMIHPDAEKGVQITDYDLQADGAFVAPTVEVRHPETPVPRCDVAQFLDVQIDVLAEIFETFLGAFCDRSPRRFEGVFVSRVVQVPDGGLRNASRLYWEAWLKKGVKLPGLQSSE